MYITKKQIEKLTKAEKMLAEAFKLQDAGAKLLHNKCTEAQANRGERLYDRASALEDRGQSAVKLVILEILTKNL